MFQTSMLAKLKCENAHILDSKRWIFDTIWILKFELRKQWNKPTIYWLIHLFSQNANFWLIYEASEK